MWDAENCNTFIFYLIFFRVRLYVLICSIASFFSLWAAKRFSLLLPCCFSAVVAWFLLISLLFPSPCFATVDFNIYVSCREFLYLFLFFFSLIMTCFVSSFCYAILLFFVFILPIQYLCSSHASFITMLSAAVNHILFSHLARSPSPQTKRPRLKIETNHISNT